MFVFDWVRWACSVWENFCWNLLTFWLWLFLLNLRRFCCQIFLKGGSCWLSVWTELFPVSVLNFSRRAALSAAKYLLMSVFKSVSRSYFWCLPGSPTIFLPICLLSDAFCLSWTPIMSAKSSWRGSCWLSVWTELCGFPVSVSSFSRRVSLVCCQVSPNVCLQICLRS